MVEPQQIFVGDALQVGEAARDRRRILGDGIAAGRRAVEADAVRVGAVVIDRVPLALAEARTIHGAGAVVVIVLAIWCARPSGVM